MCRVTGQASLTSKVRSKAQQSNRGCVLSVRSASPGRPAQALPFRVMFSRELVFKNISSTTATGRSKWGLSSHETSLTCVSQLQRPCSSGCIFCQDSEIAV